MAHTLLLCLTVKMTLLCVDGWAFCVQDILPSFKMHSQENLWASSNKGMQNSGNTETVLEFLWEFYLVKWLPSVSLNTPPGGLTPFPPLLPFLQSGSILWALHYETQGTRVLTWLAVFRTGVFWDKEATDSCISPPGHQTRGFVYFFQAESLLNWIIVIFQLSVRPEITKNLI